MDAVVGKDRSASDRHLGGVPGAVEKRASEKRRRVEDRSSTEHGGNGEERDDDRVAEHAGHKSLRQNFDPLRLL